jgi:hypothetical protein
VTRYFHKEHWITDKKLKEILSPKVKDSDNIFRQDGDDIMGIASQQAPNSSDL